MPPANSDPPFRVVVVQIGSRRNYAVPIALYRAGLLSRLYTDWYASKGWLARSVTRLAAFAPGKPFARAAARSAVGIPPGDVVHFPGFAVRYKWRKYRAACAGATPLAYIWGGETFCRQVLRFGIPPCHAVFCFSSVAKEIFEHLSGAGVARLLDQGLPPLAYDDRLLREQESAYPEWGRPRPARTGVIEYAERQRQEWAVADIILTPSQFCRRAVIEEGAPDHKIRVVPSGIHARFFEETARPNKSGKLRVLFAGNTPIRKGLPDLVLAIERIGLDPVDAVFAGETSSLTPYGLRRASQAGRLLGNVPRSRMADLYRWADVFVLPTVSDVFPAVVLEAMAAGLPVITTPNCGASEALRDQIDGFIVPIRSPDSIAEKLELFLRNPQLRAEMGENAARQAKQFTIEMYQQRLLGVLQELMT